MAKKKKKKTTISEKQQKKETKMLMLFMIIGVWLFGVFLALHMGTVETIKPGLSIFELLTSAFNHIETHPFNITFVGNSLTYILIITLVIAFVAAWVYYDRIIHRKGITKNTDGSSKWND